MILRGYIACICEGNAEHAIMDLLLENDKLRFKEKDLLDGKIIRCRDGKTFEQKYNEFKKSGKKPSEYCKADLGFKGVKNYDFVKDYFADINRLVDAIYEYKRLSNIPKREYSLSDLLK